MARAKKDPIETQANKDTGEFVKWFYDTFLDSTPDRTDYIQAQKTIKNLLYDEEGLRVYSLENLKDACTSLYNMGVGLDGFNIVMWPGLVRAVADDNIFELQKIVNSIKSMRLTDGSYTQNELMQLRPEGW